MTNAQNAQLLYESQQFLDAAVKYEFDIFKSDNIKERNSLLFSKYLCYKKLADYDAAMSTILRIKYVRSDSIQARVGYEKSLTYYLLNELSKSNLELQKLAGNQYNDSLSLGFLQVLLSVDQLNWEDARQLLSDENIFEFSDEEVEQILPNKMKPKSVDKAENLSIIPGLGQWYAGYFWKGATSGIIQAAIGGFMVYSLIEGYVFSGTLTGAAGLYTFNLGGIRHAGELANKKNAELTSGIKKRFLQRVNDRNKKRLPK